MATTKEISDLVTLLKPLTNKDSKIIRVVNGCARIVLGFRARANYFEDNFKSSSVTKRDLWECIDDLDFRLMDIMEIFEIPTEVAAPEYNGVKMMMNDLRNVIGVANKVKHYFSTQLVGRDRFRVQGCMSRLVCSLHILQSVVNELQDVKISIVVPQLQGDSVESAISNILCSVVNQGVSFIGDSVRSFFGLPAGHDSPALLNPYDGDCAIGDVPHEVKSVVFRKRDRVESHQEVLDVDFDQEGDILKRCQVQHMSLGPVSWPLTSVPGTRLVSIPTTPVKHYNTATSGTGRIGHTTTMSFFASLYRLWRGSIIYTVEVIATPMHQGQLFVAWIPGDGTGTLPSLDDCTNCLSATLDLSLADSVSLEVPYASHYDYSRNDGVALTQNPNDPREYARDCSTGVLLVFVQNSLAAPPAVAPSVYIIVHQKAGDDFELAVPVGFQGYRTVINGELQGDQEPEAVADEITPRPIGGGGGKTEVAKQEVLTVSNNEHIQISSPLSMCTTWESIDTSNVLGREYLYTAGSFNWASNSTNEVKIMDFPQDILTNGNLAIAGATQYHYLTRFSCEFTIRFATPKLYLGLGIVCYDPTGNYTRALYQLGSITQLPHVYVNVAKDSSVKLTVPWSAVVRAIPNPGSRESPRGKLFFVPITPLGVPTGAQSFITASVWIKPLAPYVGVKRVKALYQGDSALPGNQVVPEARAKPTGWISGHMRVIDLLHRPDPARDSIEWTSSPTGTNPEIPTAGKGVPMFGGINQLKILASYAFWCGSRRVKVITRLGYSANTLMFAHPKYSHEEVTADYDATWAYHSYFSGTQVWKPGFMSMIELQAPYYAPTPLSFCPSPKKRELAERNQNGVGVWEIGAQSVIDPVTPEKFLSHLFYSVGDDFSVHFPIFTPFFATVIPPELEPDILDQGEDGWVRDLTQEGIEPNPGPVMSKLRGLFGYGEAETDDISGSVAPDLASMLLNNIESGPQGLPSAVAKCLSYFAHRLVDPYVQGAKRKTEEMKAALIKNILPILTWFSDFCLNIYIIFSGAAAAVTLAALSALSMKVVQVGLLGTQLLKQLKEVIDNPSILIVSQGPLDLFKGAFGEKRRELIGTISSFVIASLTMLVGKSVSERQCKLVSDWSVASVFPEVMSKVGQVGSGVRGIATLWDSLRVVLDRILDWFLQGDSIFHNWFVDNKIRLRQWVRDWDNFVSSGSLELKKLYVVCDGVSNIDRLFNYFLPIAKEVRLQSLADKTYFSIYQRVASDVITRSTQCSEKIKDAVNRVEPIGLCIYGEPGSGKSFLTSTLLPSIVLNRVGFDGRKQKLPDLVYCMPRDPEHKYMDGYHNQPWVIIDDFAQATDNIDFLSIINLISCTHCPANMANCNEKNAVFDSAFVVCSTNREKFSNASTVVDVGAALRRFPFQIRMVPKGGASLQVGRLVQELEAKVCSVQEISDICAKYFTLEKHDFSPSGQVARQVAISLAELAEEMVLKYQSRNKIYSVASFISQKLFSDSVMQGDSDDEDFVSMYGSLGSDAVAEDYYEFTAETYISAARSAGDDPGKWGYLKEYFLLYRERMGFGSDFPTQFSDLWGKLARKWPPICEYEGCIFVVLKAIGVTTAIVAVGALLYLLVSALIRFIFKSVFVTQGPQYDKSVRRELKTTRKAVFQGEETDKMVAIGRNVRRIRIRFPDGKDWGMNALCLDYRHFLIPNHFYERWCVESQDSAVVEIARVSVSGDILGFQPICLNDTNSVKMDLPGVFRGLRYTNVDARLVRLVGSNLNNVRNIKHHLITDAVWGAMARSKREVSLLGVKGPTIPAVADLNDLAIFGGRSDYVGVCYDLSVATVGGDCGRACVLANRGAKQPLLGFHVALNVAVGRQGIFSPISAECVESAMKRLDAVVERPVDLIDVDLSDLVVQGEPNEFHNTTIENLGKVSFRGEKLERFSPAKTDLVRTGYKADDWTDVYEPSQKRVVRLGDKLVHPLYSNGQKYEPLAIRAVSVEAQVLVRESYLKHIPVQRGLIWSEFQMINGSGSVPPLVMSTSSGFLSKYFGEGKKQLFDPLPQLAVDGQLLEQTFEFSDKAKTMVVPLFGKSFTEHLQECDDKINRGEVILTLWTSTLKDELREVEKVRIGKTRVFEQPSLEYTLLVRKYFGAFLDWFKTNAGFKLMHGIGNDKERVWGYYYRTLKRWGGIGFDLDFSNYDGSVHVAAVDFFLAVVDKFYGEVGRKARHALVRSLTRSIHVIGSDVMLSEQGNKSGNPMTDVFNSITNVWFLRTAYLYASAERGIFNLDDFDANVVGLTYGDDVICAVNHGVEEWFNRMLCKKVGDMLGYKVTSASKSGLMIPYESIDDLTFLKSGFVDVGSCVLAPLPEKVIHRCMMWQHKQNVGDMTILKQRMMDGLSMMVHHGRDVYDKLYGQLVSMKLDVDYNYESKMLDIVSKQSAYDRSMMDTWDEWAEVDSGPFRIVTVEEVT